MAATPLKRILYVDDDTDIQAVAEMALATVGGFDVRVCSSGEQALREAGGFDPDLVLLDVVMPGMDGPQTLSALRKQAGFNALPVVFMTAKVMPEDLDSYHSLGAMDVIAKPFDPLSLAQRVDEIWEAHHG